MLSHGDIELWPCIRYEHVSFFSFFLYFHFYELRTKFSYIKELQLKKSRIRETKNLSSDMDSSNDTKNIPAQEGKICQKTNFLLRSNFTPFISKSFQIRHHFFPLLFSKDSESLKTLDIQSNKKMFKRYLKSEQTDGRTDTRTDILTYRNNRHRGPILKKKDKTIEVFL